MQPESSDSFQPYLASWVQAGATRRGDPPPLADDSGGQAERPLSWTGIGLSRQPHIQVLDGRELTLGPFPSAYSGLAASR